ncbi:MAG: hypothetical protein Q4G10_08950 [Bacteroidia bacterium]|nr:hypothetical protein [Bacteroidia bacterium]
MEKNFYHLFSDGADAKNLITSEEDYKYEFNLFGACKLLSGVDVAAFSIEDSHVHGLLYGTHEECYAFKHYYEDSTIRHIIATRGNKDNVVFELTLDLIDNPDYLLKAAAYVIVQPTKDGKKVMQYDYLWGTGSMYFRSSNHIPIWQVGNDGRIIETKEFRSLPYRDKKRIVGSHENLIPDSWTVCNGLLLPANYVDVGLYEDIFRTYNRFRVFSCANKKVQDEVIDRMAQARGIMLEDLEARSLCREICKSMFHKETARHLSTDQRLILGRALWRRYHMSLRQLSLLCRLPQDEIAKYL